MQDKFNEREVERTRCAAEAQKPLAVVVVFGLISSTALSLTVEPLRYDWFESDAVKEIERE